MKKTMFNDRYGLTQAVINGRKRETRRVELTDNEQIVIQELCASGGKRPHIIRDCIIIRDGYGTEVYRKPTRYSIGEIVAVAQSYKDAGYVAKRYERLEDRGYGYISGNGMDEIPMSWPIAGFNNKMFTRADLMPHQIKITGIRIERLQDISRESCLREGIEPMLVGCEYYVFSIIDKEKGCWHDYMTPSEAFAALIDKVSGRGTWDRNPYVVVYEFELLK